MHQQYFAKIAAIVLAGGAIAPAIAAQNAFPGRAWQQYASPEQAGFDEARLDDVRTFAEKAGSAAVFIVQNGHVVAAWGDIERKFKCHSVRKSLLSALIGIHVHEGHIDMEKTIAELGIDDLDALSAQEKQATIADLIRARSGIYHPAAKEPPGMKRNRPARGSHKPGEHFFYNNWDFNTLGVIFEQETGKKIFEEFDARIAKPIGMEDFCVEDGSYQLEPSYSRHPAYAFRMSARDLARFGWLFANSGEWNQEQVIPEAWVSESTSIHSRKPGDIGYGYMWWVWEAGLLAEQFPNLAKYKKFMAQGTGGQLALVIPEADFVLVHRGDTDAKMFGPRLRVSVIAEQVLAARTGAPKPNPQLVPVTPVPFATAVPPPPKRTAIKIDPASLQDYVGTFQSQDGMRIRVHVHQGRLFGHAPGQGEAELLFLGTDRCFLNVAPSELVFERDASGNVVGGNLTMYGKEQRLTRVK